jgi:hypothetical protein
MQQVHLQTVGAGLDSSTPGMFKAEHQITRQKGNSRIGGLVQFRRQSHWISYMSIKN